MSIAAEHDSISTPDLLEEPLLPLPEPQSTNAATNNNNHHDNEKHRNIPVMLWYQFLRCFPEAIWLTSVLSAYVYLIRPQNPELVGYLSAVEGIAQFLAACIAGVLADLYRRDVLLRVSSLIGLVASILVVLSVKTHALWFLVVALGLNGAFDGIGLTASFAVFADSIQEGERSHYFTQRTLSTTFGQVFGPLVGLILFYLQGDHWSVQTCAHVMIVAQILLLPGFVLLWLFQDVPKEEEHEQQNNNRPNSIEPEESIDPLLTTTINTEEEETTIHNTTLYGCCTTNRFIAASCAGSDLVSSFANGVSTRYFAVFFLKDLHWGPVLVQILDALSCLLEAALLLLAQRTSRTFGRCPVSVAFKTAGIVWIVAMVLTYQWFPPSTLSHTTIAVLYLLQNAFLNSTGALTRSLIMDHVPQHERAKWSALESINIFGWCGSAAVGGMVVKVFRGNVLPVFFLTAILQVVGSLPLVALFGMQDSEQQQHQQQQANNAGEDQGLDEGGDGQQDCPA